MSSDITVTMSMSKYEEMQDRIKFLSESNLYNFVRYVHEDDSILKKRIGKSLDVDKIMAYLEANIDERYDLFIKLDEDRLKLTDHSEEDKDHDCGTF